MFNKKELFLFIGLIAVSHLVGWTLSVLLPVL